MPIRTLLISLSILLFTFVPIAQSAKIDKNEGSSDLAKLTYHNGPVLSSTIVVHPIWYGKWAPSQKRIIRSFIRSVSNTSVKGPSVSAWWSTVRLYDDQTGSKVTSRVILGKEKVDLYSQGKSLTRLSVQSIIKNAISAPVKPLPVNPKGGLYLVLSSPDVYMESFCTQVCGFHYFTFASVVGYTLPYAWPERPPNGDMGVDGMVAIISHELAETATDPLINGWYAGDQDFPNEIADLCLGIYGTGGGASYQGKLLRDKRTGAVYNMNGVDGRKFLVQWDWHRYKNYCWGPNALD
ncbi:hypothetical protein LUZ60_016197 [Juncus effusus]|nr:hypothetical protein LUZ60_016197 [Juncus effusus]